MWKLERSSKDAMEVADSGSFQLSSLRHDVNVLVYVREVKMDLRLLQDQYSKMIHGQA